MEDEPGQQTRRINNKLSLCTWHSSESLKFNYRSATTCRLKFVPRVFTEEEGVDEMG